MSVDLAQEEMRNAYVNIWIGEVWNKGNVNFVDSIFHPDFEDHRPIPQFPGNVDGHKLMAADWHQAFPDVIFNIEDIIIQGNLLAARYVAEGTHTGVILGIQGTGVPVSLTGIDIFGFENGLVRHWWHEEDFDTFIKPILAADAERKKAI
ncbi:Predicted ester cyclase [Pseudomonas sp. NFACC23-1]|uniref:ester cyclase n=1 Tax=unclassified Pseudomonas TaxID=196821 RepID=UPI00088AC17A|nr:MULTISPECIES: ester cyclase [unclassified Pseudomonas]SDB49466.1 Predicted ester cyclase [Pseudomonas sp. NFACC17-2]SEJ68360.1 Predicted ester cyclase [Pseudomonas sp. NFACC23-1]SFW76808.1 Predicted ester cyclase [Pseudomonas sp. NFACC16-2]